MRTRISVAALLLSLLLVSLVTLPVTAATPQSGGEAPIPLGGDLSGPQGPAEAVAGEAEVSLAPAPTKDKNSNTPFFIGAGVAVLMFAGVALYCKANGNKSF